MDYWRSLKSVPENLNNTAVTLGSFDGLHAGHRYIINALLQKAGDDALSSIVISFNPYPKEFFSKQRMPRLMSWREQFLGLQKMGVDYFLTIPFTAELAAMSANDFVSDILVDQLKARVLVIGDDYHFGRNREGDYHFLQSVSKRYGFEVIQLPTYTYQGERISSSRVRSLLTVGDMQAASALLGHHYYLCGTVIHGDKLGRQLGFPTANIDLHRRSVPLSGVFVVQVSGIDNVIYRGVANIGTRPAVQGTRALLEIYLFDFNQDIYGLNIKVEFLKKLRDEENYATLIALVNQINQDVIDSKNFFNT